MRVGPLIGLCAGFLFLASSVGWGASGPIEITEALAIRTGAAGRGGGRSLISIDAVSALLAKGELAAPKAGEKLGDGQAATWQTVKANKDGIFQQQGGYVYCSIDLPEPAVMLLEASGHGIAFVNGTPHVGDTYSYGYLRIPVALKKGNNALLFTPARGRFKVRLLPIRADAMIDVADPTLPDLLPTDKEPLWASVVIQNNTDKEVKGLKLTARASGGEAKTSELPAIAPLSIRKVPFRIVAPQKLEGEKCAISLELQGPGGKLDAAEVTLRVRQPLQTHKRTFVSRIDGSVQYYAINPAQKPSDSNALVLTLHGASVEAIGQADAYKSKDWVTIVAPTNRRPYGFDWEDVGQLDALEVLEIAEKAIPHDPQRVVLTGHSMGGHGAWHVGLTFPDRFAAIGPSAGWSSFASYTGGRGGRGGAASQPSGMQQLLATANAAGDTLSLVRNSLSEEVYILHGDADDNVPVREARLMREALKFHPRLSYHEEPGAGHWWGGKCVDWPDLFQMFERVRLPADADVKDVEFTTADPAMSGRFHWVTIEQQIQPMRPSTISLKRNEATISGAAKNVAMLNFDVSALKGVHEVELDGQSVSVPEGERVVLRRREGKWAAAGSAVDPKQKNSKRGGPFVTVFDHRVMFVYGTGGKPGAAADALATARQLAEAFYYRGNGSIDVIADTEFSASESSGRNVVLFGNADNNRAWAAVLGDSPIRVNDGSIIVGKDQFKGDDLGAVFVRPREGNAENLVGAVASSGHGGTVVIERLPMAVSGVGLPDWTVIGADTFSTGIGGVRAAGYFGNDWGLDSGEKVARER
jgi:pimeloyl-ACP methyl ester carboxylesterase